MTTITSYTQSSPFKECLGSDARFLPEVKESMTKLLRKLGVSLLRSTGLKTQRIRFRGAIKAEFPTGVLLLVEVFMAPELVRVEMRLISARTTANEITTAKEWAKDLTRAAGGMEAMEAEILGMGFTAASKWSQTL